MIAGKTPDSCVGFGAQYSGDRSMDVAGGASRMAAGAMFSFSNPPARFRVSVVVRQRQRR